MTAHRINLKKRFAKKKIDLDKKIARDILGEDFATEEYFNERLRKLGTQKVIHDLEDLLQRTIFLHNRGFDPRDTWSLASTLAKHLIPRLKHLKLTKCGYPGIDEASTDKKWNKVMDKMITAFELVSDDSIMFFTKKQKKQYDEGIELFRKYFRDLWD